MKNSEKNNLQILLFEQIRKVIPPNYVLVDVISEHLQISPDAAYRRIRGEKLMDIQESIALCRHFDISFDALADITQKNQIRCTLVPNDLKELKESLAYIQALSNRMARLKSNFNSEIFVTAADLPVFNYLAYKELTFFYMFSWQKNIYDIEGSYEDFAGGLDVDEFANSFEKIKLNYQNIPSTEVWTASTIDSILRLLNYHYEMRHFNNKKIPLLICEQLMDLMNTLQSWIKKGAKGSNGNQIKFYVSEIDINSSL